MCCREEADEYIDIGALNGIFVLGRSMGFIGELVVYYCLKSFLGLFFFFFTQGPSYTTYPCSEFLQKRGPIDLSLFLILPFSLLLPSYFYLCSFILGNDFSCEPRKIELNPTLNILPSLASTYWMDLDLPPHFFYLFVLERFPFLSSPLHQTLTSSSTLNKKMHLLYFRTLSWSEETEAGAVSSPMGWYFICSSGTHEHVTEPGTVLQ